MILHHEFIKTAKRYPKKEAIADRTTGKRLTYQRTLIASFILARRIRHMPDCYIGIMVPTSAGSFLSVLGTVMTGKVPVMINYSTGAADNCTYAQRKCGFSTIITSRALLEKVNCPELPGMVFLEDIMEQIGTLEKTRAALAAHLPLKLLVRMVYAAKLDDVAVILFTSGSEKEPKAVELTHGNLGSNIRDVVQMYQLESNDTIMSILPLFHVFGHTVVFWMPMIVGMKAVTHANPLDYKKIPRIIHEEKADMIAATPVFFAGYLREARPNDFDSLRLLVAGGDRVPDWLREEYRKKHGKTLLEGYGTTETSPVISTNTPAHVKPGSIGKPVPSAQVRIVHMDTGEDLPIDTPGKIVVKGDLVMKGYFSDLEETSLRVKDGWYDTGDMGKRDTEGYLWHLGRLKRFVKIGGEMVSLVRTESELSKLLPSDTDCCVVEVPDRAKGAKLVAAVTAPIDEKAVLRELSRRVPRLGIPSTFVQFDELPKMGNGKTDFRTITAMVHERLGAQQ